MNTDIIMGDTGLPVARELAEMLLIKNDLDQSFGSLTIWTEWYSSEGKEDPRTKVINGSLFRDGITQFVSCFDRKNALPLVVETVFPNVEGIAPYFRWLRSLRNSYTAHRHGAARQCKVAAMIRPTSGEYLGRYVLFAVYAGSSQEGHAPLLSLISMAIRYVDARISALEQQFDIELAAIAPAELLKLPTAAVQPQGPEQIGKSRGDVTEAISREQDERS